MSRLFCFSMISFLFIQWGDQLSTNAQPTKKKSFGLKGSFEVPDALLKGYEYFPGVGYYKFYPEGTYSFNDAKSICENEGGYLAIPNSQNEINVLKKIYGRYPKLYHYAFIGFHDMNEEGKFITIFGQNLQDTGFSKWEKGEPNQGFGNEDCGTIKKNGNLNDLRCKLNYLVPFFCEYNAN